MGKPEKQQRAKKIKPVSGREPSYMKQKSKSKKRIDPKTKRVTIRPIETKGIRIAKRGGGRAYGKNS